MALELLSRLALWAGPDLSSATLDAALSLGIETVHLFASWQNSLQLVASRPQARVILTLGEPGRPLDELSLSLTTLGRDQVDTLLLYYPEKETFRHREPIDFLKAQRGHTASRIGWMARDQGVAMLTHHFEMDMVCMHHNWYRREQAIEVFPLAASHEVPVMAAQVLSGSRLQSPETARLHGHFPGVSLARLALGYALHDDSVISASLDPSSPQELEGCLPVPALSASQMTTIDRVLLGLQP